MSSDESNANSSKSSWLRYLHVDMDAFFASVEQRENVNLRGKPVAVGSPNGRSVVAAASYEARCYGVSSAMPSFRAQQLCPELIFIRGNADLYLRIGEEIKETLGRFSAYLEPVSVDESFLDISACRLLWPSVKKLATDVKKTVEGEHNLRCSVGAADLRPIAKLASEHAKPRIRDGKVTKGMDYFSIYPHELQSYLSPLPVRSLWGVGPKTSQKLNSMGIVTVNDLWEISLGDLEYQLGVAHASYIYHLIRGVEISPLTAKSNDRKSMSQERTFYFDIFDMSSALSEVNKLVDELVFKLRKLGLLASTVSIKFKDTDHKIYQKSFSFDDPQNTFIGIWPDVRRLAEIIFPHDGVRLIGVSFSGLKKSHVKQRSIFDELDSESSGNEEQKVTEQWEIVGQAIDEIRYKHGLRSIFHASNLSNNIR